MPERLRIVVTGLIAQHPSLGGVTWDYAQYAAGLAQLGHDVYYLEDSGEWPYRLDGGEGKDTWIAYDPSPNVEHLARTMARFGLEDRWMYRFPISPRWYGLTHKRRREVLATADLLLNVSGTLKRPSDYRGISRLAYVDSDPVFTQVKLAQHRGQKKFQKRFAAHDVFFSFGERIAETEFSTDEYGGGIRWHPTRQPVLLSEWEPDGATRDVFTTVMSWTSYRPLRYRGRSFGQKDVEIRRLLDLPRHVAPQQLEVAMGGANHTNWETGEGSADVKPADLLRSRGWNVVNAASVSSSLEQYHGYVTGSKGELSVAKHGYVAGQTGWFSCRSACYLAAGRPVVVQDTGFRTVIPTGEGVVAFDDAEGAAEGIRDVSARYARHSRAARELAREYFDSGTVLSRLIEQAMASMGAVR